MLSPEATILDLLRWSFFVSFGLGVGWTLGCWLMGRVIASVQRKSG